MEEQELSGIVDLVNRHREEGATLAEAAEKIRAQNPILSAIHLAQAFAKTLFRAGAQLVGGLDDTAAFSQAMDDSLAGAKEIAGALKIAGYSLIEIVPAIIAPGVYPGLTAYQLGTVLMAPSVFPDISERDMRSALQGANFSQSEIDNAIARLFSPPILSINRLFWSSTHGSSALRSSALDGTDINSVGPYILMPGVLAADNVNGKLYYAQDFDPAVIGRMNFDGGGSETVVEGLVTILSLAVDPVGGYLFWGHMSQRSNGAIQRSDLNGKNIITIADNVNPPTGVAVDARNKLVYWIGGGLLTCAQLDGSGARTLVTPFLGGARSPQLDRSGSNIYYVGMAGVARVPIPVGGQPVIVVAGQMASNLGCLVFQPGTDTMFWTEQANGVIRSAKSDGSDVKTIAQGLDNPNGIAILAGSN